MKIENYYCDICKKEAVILDKEILVIFNYDQVDGKSKVKPYLNQYQLSFCTQCWNTMMIEGKMLFGYGAMGHNTYSFKRF